MVVVVVVRRIQRLRHKLRHPKLSLRISLCLILAGFNCFWTVEIWWGWVRQLSLVICVTIFFFVPSILVLLHVYYMLDATFVYFFIVSNIFPLLNVLESFFLNGNLQLKFTDISCNAIRIYESVTKLDNTYYIVTYKIDLLLACVEKGVVLLDSCSLNNLSQLLSFLGLDLAIRNL